MAGKLTLEQTLHRLVVYYKAVNRVFMKEFERSGAWNDGASACRAFETQLSRALEGVDPVTGEDDDEAPQAQPDLPQP